MLEVWEWRSQGTEEACLFGFVTMVSYRRLLAVVEAALLTPNPAPHHRADLSHALHVCLPDLQAFLKYPVSGSLSSVFFFLFWHWEICVSEGGNLVAWESSCDEELVRYRNCG